MNGQTDHSSEFLGAGIAFPLHVNENGLIAMNALEDHDDVKNVYANFDIPKEIIEAGS